MHRSAFECACAGDVDLRTCTVQFLFTLETVCATFTILFANGVFYLGDKVPIGNESGYYCY
jgi:hypothetical protein